MNPALSYQPPRAVLMIRPRHFTPNPQTAADNGFQQPAAAAEQLCAQARTEVGHAAATLKAAGVQVQLFDEPVGADTPDAVFPNNWFSTHPEGDVALYPMHAPNRRAERRADVLTWLRRHHRVRRVVDYSGHELEGQFLEGTGALVLDHRLRTAYMARSQRASEALLQRFCQDFGFAPFAFDTRGPSDQPIYHTNVLMCVGQAFALVGLSLLPDAAQAAALRQSLARGGRTVIELSAEQIAAFAGNALELQGRGGPLLALSARAQQALLPAQREALQALGLRLLPLAVPTIERAGGSVRCMLAELHLTPLHRS